MISLLLLVISTGILLYQGYKIRSLTKEHEKIRKKLEETSKELLLTSRYTSIGETAKSIVLQWKEPLQDIRTALLLHAGDSQEKFLKSLKTNINLIHRLIETFDTFSNFLTSHHSTHFSLSEQLTKILTMTEYLFKNSHIEVTYEIDTDHTIEGDANEFIHAILNLLINAKNTFDKNPVESPRIIIRVSCHEYDCSIVLSDNAGGIKITPLDIIFSRSVSLAFSKNIIEKHFQGTIHVETRNNGAYFTLTLPYSRQPEDITSSDEVKEMMTLERSRVFNHQLFNVEYTQRHLERWGYVFDQAHWGIVVYMGIADPIEMTNQTMSTLYGYTPEEFKTLSISDLFIPESHQFLPKFKQFAHERGYAIFKSLHKRKDGSTFPASIELIIVKNKDGEIIYHIANIWDLTDKKTLEQNLNLKRFALNHIKDGLFLINEQGNFHYVNAGASQSLGYSRNELLMLNVCDVDPDWPIERWPEHWNEVKEHRSITMDVRHKCKDGTIIPIEINANYIEFEGVGYIIAIARDLTTRKLLETEKSKQFISLITENSPDIIIRFDLELHITYMNSSAKVFFGYDMHQNINKLLSDFIPNEHVHYFKDVITTGEFKEIDQTLYNNNNNNECYLFFKIVAERNSENEIIGAIAIGRDLSERRAARDALKQSEQNYRALVENASDFIIRYDADARILYLNPQLEKELKITLDQTKGKTPTELSEEIYHDYEILLRNVIATGVNSEIYLMLPDTGNGLRTHHVHLIAEWDTEGNIIGAMTVGRDVSELKYLNQTLKEINTTLEEHIQERTADLRESEEVFRAIVESSPDIIARYDLSMRRIYVNPMMEFLLGKPKNEILGKTPREFSPLQEQEVESFEQMFNAVLLGKSELTHEAPYLTPWGETRLGSLRMIPLLDEHREMIGIIGIGRDITDRDSSIQTT